MVTHNANLVIATDDEQVIVAHQTVLDELDERTKEKKSKFAYVTGALEHTMKKREQQEGDSFYTCKVFKNMFIKF